MNAVVPGAAAAVAGPQPLPPVPMTAHEVASSIRRWTVEKNLCQALPAVVEQLVLANVAPAVFSEAQEGFLRARGITSIAYGEDDKKVFVYTKRKVTKTEIKQLPNYINGCEIEYPQGNIDDLRETPAEAQAATYAIHPGAAGTDFYTCGSSISPGNSASAGTLGVLVQDANGTMFGLSNNHVTGSCSHSPPGLPILAPGVIDVMPNALNPFTIGLHASALPMGAGAQGNVDIFQNQDAAIFEIVNPLVVSSMQRDAYDTPSIVEAPIVGMLVEKAGRTTGHTTGKIIGQELMPVRVGVSAQTYDFRAHVYFADAYVIHGDPELFSDDGDSGSLIVCRKPDGSMSAVGLLFAGGPDSAAPGQKKTLMLPLQPILHTLGVTLVHGHNV